MKTVTSNQRKMNQHIAAITNSDAGTAFINCSMVKRLLTVAVTGEIFVLLVKICHKAGANQFRNHLALQMVNTGHSKESVKRYIASCLTAN